MRIFERLRGRERAESNIERKPVETIAVELLRRAEDQTDLTVLPEIKSTCCSGCSADGETRR
jgi:RNase P subunit RPR2